MSERELLNWVHITPTARLNFTLSLEFKLADMWVGAYWTHRAQHPMPRWRRTDIWLCALPTLPLHLVLYTRKAVGKAASKNVVST